MSGVCSDELLTSCVFFTESHDGFFLAPEYQEHGIVTEKVCLSELVLPSCTINWLLAAAKVFYSIFMHHLCVLRSVCMGLLLSSGRQPSSAYHQIRSWRCLVK